MIVQGTDEWFKARCGRITGTRFAAVMAIGKTGPLQERRNLIVTVALERLFGNPIEQFQNEAMRWGKEQEANARAWYEFCADASVSSCGFEVDPEHDFIGVSPDGMVDGERGLEIKCPYNVERHAATLLSRTIPDEYVPQVQGQMMVMGWKRIDYVSYHPKFPGNLRGIIIPVPRDDEYIARLRAECVKVNTEIEAMVQQLRERM